MPRPTVRTLGLDPAPRGIAFVVLDGRDYLIDWGIPVLKTRTTREADRKVRFLIARFAPTFLVVEHHTLTRRRRRARRIIEKIGSTGDALGLPVIEVSRPQVREHFSQTDGTKYEIALALAALFPELEHRLPRKRKPWMSEDERMNIFDALSFVATALGANWPQLDE